MHTQIHTIPSLSHSLIQHSRSLCVFVRRRIAITQRDVDLLCMCVCKSERVTFGIFACKMFMCDSESACDCVCVYVCVN